MVIPFQRVPVYKALGNIAIISEKPFEDDPENIDLKLCLQSPREGDCDKANVLVESHYENPQGAGVFMMVASKGRFQILGIFLW